MRMDLFFMLIVTQTEGKYSSWIQTYWGNCKRYFVRDTCDIEGKQGDSVVCLEISFECQKVGTTIDATVGINRA